MQKIDSPEEQKQERLVEPTRFATLGRQVAASLAARIAHAATNAGRRQEGLDRTKRRADTLSAR